MQRDRFRATVAGVVIAGAGLGTVGVAAATSDDGPDAREDQHEGVDRPIPARDLARAEAAALAHTGGGRVTGTEVDDEESKYEVEVTLDDGSQVDVQLDEAFHVVGADADHGG
jgi:uncharacterized membrane protein YkoI